MLKYSVYSIYSVYSVTFTILRVQPSVYKACCHYNPFDYCRTSSRTFLHSSLTHSSHETLCFIQQPVVCGSIAKRVSAVRPRDCQRQLQELCLESVSTTKKHRKVLRKSCGSEIKLIQKRIAVMSRPTTV